MGYAGGGGCVPSACSISAFVSHGGGGGCVPSACSMSAFVSHGGGGGCVPSACSMSAFVSHGGGGGCVPSACSMSAFVSHGGGGGCVPSAKPTTAPGSSPPVTARCEPRCHETASATMAVKHTSLFEYIYFLHIEKWDLAMRPDSE